MPWVDLCSADDYASIFYRTNTQYSNVSGFSPEKPTIVVLHPLYLDTTWLDLQFGDARLSRSYNMIAFDMRSAGRSVCRPNGRHDSWVDAADLAFCFYVCLSQSRRAQLTDKHSTCNSHRPIFSRSRVPHATRPFVSPSCMLSTSPPCSITDPAPAFPTSV